MSLLDLTGLAGDRKNRLSIKFGAPWQPNHEAPLGHIAQIDLSEYPHIDGELPNSGWLYFFYDRHCEPWGFDPADRGCCRVIYVNCERADLIRATPPEDLDPEHIAHVCQLTATPELTLREDLPGLDYESTAYDACQVLRDELAEGTGLAFHHLLGHPQLVQNPMELECQLVSNGIYCGNPSGYECAKAKVLSAGAEDWQLLFQIDTDEEGPGWMWGDVGRIYFWIRKQDLAALRFDYVWLIFQCS